MVAELCTCGKRIAGLKSYNAFLVEKRVIRDEGNPKVILKAPQYTTDIVLFTTFMATSETADPSYFPIQLMANYTRLDLLYLQIICLKEPKSILLYEGFKSDTVRV